MFSNQSMYAAFLEDRFSLLHHLFQVDFKEKLNYSKLQKLKKLMNLKLFLILLTDCQTIYHKAILFQPMTRRLFLLLMIWSGMNMMYFSLSEGISALLRFGARRYARAL